MNARLVLNALLAAAAIAAPGCSTSPKPAAPSAAASAPIATRLASLPETVTSFGAVSDAGWLYAFGGHKGERHDYSAGMVSGSFHRLNLQEGRAWEPLPGSDAGQGLPLVAHEGRIYRVGGMAARNPSGAKQDLYSLDVVRRFDPRRGRWEACAPLPEPRSSHDAVAVGNQLFVAGGWRLTGGTNKPAWPRTALMLDLANAGAGWKEIPQPFQRRALALAALGTRVFCIGGMDSDNQTTLAVQSYDTATGQWSQGPDLPPGKHKGFGCSAIAQDGRIYASAFPGDVLRLSSDERSWEVAGRLRHPRMAHRLVAAGQTQLIALGGEDGEEKRPELELVTPAAAPLVAGPAAASGAAPLAQ